MKGNATSHAAICVLVILAPAFTMTGAVAQTGTADSAEVRSRVRGAQRDLEELRRKHLPHVPTIHRPPVARIGDREIWMETRPREPIPVADPEFVNARADFLALLDSAAAVLGP